MPYTLETFGQAIKAKHPEYNDLSDRELGQKMLAKYPDYGDIVSDHSGVQQFIQQSTPSTNLAVNFGKSLPGAIGETFVKNPVKLATSLGEGINQVVKTGGQQNASGKTYNIPLLGQFKSFQSEAIDRKKVGQNPLLNIAQGAFETGMAGLDTIGAAKSGSKLLGLGAEATQKKLLKEAVDITKPVMNKKLAINTLKQSGIADKGVQETGLLGKMIPKTTNYDKQVAESVQGLVSKNQSPVKNIIKINDEIGRISEQEIKPVLRANKALASNQKVSTIINNIEPTRLIKSDASLNNTYNQVKELMLEKIGQNAKNAKGIDSEGLWNARKQFDHAVEDQFGDAVYNPEKNSAVKAAVRDIRDKVNDMVGQLNPTFKPQIRKISNMYHARDNIAEQNYKLLIGGANKLTRFFSEHPKTTSILKKGGAIAGAGLVGEGVLRRIGK